MPKRESQPSLRDVRLSNGSLRRRRSRRRLPPSVRRMAQALEPIVEEHLLGEQAELDITNQLYKAFRKDNVEFTELQDDGEFVTIRFGVKTAKLKHLDTIKQFLRWITRTYRELREENIESYTVQYNPISRMYITEILIRYKE